MIPVCLVLGDSTALGAASALAAAGVRCEVHGRVGASSAETLRTWRGGGPVARVLIGLGSNDPLSPALGHNLLELRRRTAAGRVTWLAPYNIVAARVVVTVAAMFGDQVISLAYQPTRDRLHPSSYRPIAASLGWRDNGAIPPDIPVKQKALVPAVLASIRPTRKATVIVFQ